MTRFMWPQFALKPIIYSRDPLKTFHFCVWGKNALVSLKWPLLMLPDTRQILTNCGDILVLFLLDWPEASATSVDDRD